MRERLFIKTWVDGVSDPLFLDQEITEYTLTLNRMGLPSLTATVRSAQCLDQLWTGKEYVTVRGAKMWVKHTPASKKANDDTRYVHEIEFSSEHERLAGLYFMDCVTKDASTKDKPCSNSTKVVFYGPLTEFAGRINATLAYWGIGDSILQTKSTLLKGVDTPAGDGYCVIVDSSGGYDIDSTREASFEDEYIWDALRIACETWEVPFAIHGKQIVFGEEGALVDETFEYGADNPLLMVGRSNAGNLAINEITAKGSSDNLPYYYPNNTEFGNIAVSCPSSNAAMSASDFTIVNAATLVAAVREGQEITLQAISKPADAEMCAARYASNNALARVSGVLTGETVTDASRLWWDWQTIGGFPSNTDWVKYDQDRYVVYVSNVDTAKFMKVRLGVRFRVDSARSYKLKAVNVFVKLEGTSLAMGETAVNALAQGLFIAEEMENSAGEKGGLRQDPTTHEVYMDDLVEGEYSIIGTLIMPKDKFPTKDFDWIDFYWRLSSASIVPVDANYNEYQDGTAQYRWKTSDRSFYDISQLGLAIDESLLAARVGDKLSWTASDRMPFLTQLTVPLSRRTSGDRSFYKATNQDPDMDSDLWDAYINPDTSQRYNFPNPYNANAPQQYVFVDESIKPTIEGVKNLAQQEIGRLLAIAYDENDSDAVDSDGNYINQYFYARLPMMNGPADLDLFGSASQTETMELRMTSGACNGCTFKIKAMKQEQASGRYSFWNPVQVDSDGNLVDGDGRVSSSFKCANNQSSRTNSLWVCLQKDADTFGVLMPNAANGFRPAPGDTFEINNIDLPVSYILAAEARLAKAMMKYMAENNEEKSSFEVGISRVYCAQNPAIADSIDENSRMLVRYDGRDHICWVESVTITCKDSDALPELAVTLANESLPGESYTQRVAAQAVTESVAAAKKENASAIEQVKGYDYGSAINELSQRVSALENIDGTKWVDRLFKYEDEDGGRIRALFNLYSVGYVSALGAGSASGSGSGSGSGVDALSLLVDVALDNPASGQILRYDGTHWVNVPLESVTPSLDGYATQTWVNGKVDGMEACLLDLDARVQSLAVTNSVSELTASHVDTETLGAEYAVIGTLESSKATAEEFIGNLTGTATNATNADNATNANNANTLGGTAKDGLLTSVTAANGSVGVCVGGKTINATASGTWGISISGNAATATNALNDHDGNDIRSTYLKVEDFEKMFVKEEVSTGVYRIKALYDFYSVGYVSALGSGSASGGGSGSGSGAGLAFGRLDDWANYNPNGTDALSATLGYGLKTDISNLSTSLTTATTDIQRIASAVLELNGRIESLSVLGSLSELSLSHLDTETAGIENAVIGTLEVNSLTATLPWASITSTPTTIAGYGITDVNTYAPTLSGTGATGTWGISISGNAATATDAAKLGGTAKGDLFTALSLSASQLSATIGGTVKTVNVPTWNQDTTGKAQKDWEGNVIHTTYLKKAVFDDLFEKESDGNGGYRIKAKYSFYSEGYVSALGSGGAGSAGTSVGLLKSWDGAYDADTDALSAALGVSLKSSLDSLSNTVNNHGASITSLNSRVTVLEGKTGLESFAFSQNGSGNAVTNVAWSNNTLTVTKGAKFALSSDLDLLSSAVLEIASRLESRETINSLSELTLGHLDTETLGAEYATIGNLEVASLSASLPWSSITETPTKIADYGITDVNDYAPTLSGVGATGTWGISVTGNAATASKLLNAVEIWGQSFNGSASISGALSNATTITASGLVTGAQFKATGKKIYFGDNDHYIELTADGVFHFSHGLYSDSFVSALGSGAAGSAAGGALSLLSDVQLGSEYPGGYALQANDVLRYNGTHWVNVPQSVLVPSTYTLTFSAGAFTAGSYKPTESAKTIYIPNTTDHISEGTANKYYTDSRVEQKVTQAYIKSKLAISDWALASVKPTYSFADLTSHPDTLSGYGITDAASTTDVQLISSAILELNARLESLAVTSSLSELTLSHIDAETAGIEYLTANGIEADTITATEGFTGDLTGNADTATDAAKLGGTAKGDLFTALSLSTSQLSATIGGTTKTANIPTWNQDTTGNAGSATKLKTARYIWGQSFDGQANVTGSLTDVTTITASGLIKTTSNLQGSMLRLVGSKLYFGNDDDHYIELTANGFKFSASLYSVGAITALSDGGVEGSGSHDALSLLTDVWLGNGYPSGYALSSNDVLVYDGTHWRNVPQNTLTPDLNQYATQAWVGQQNYLTAHQPIYSLTFGAGAHVAGSYNPASAAKTVKIPTNTDHIGEGTANKYYTDDRVKNVAYTKAEIDTKEALLASAILELNGRVESLAVTSSLSELALSHLDTDTLGAESAVIGSLDVESLTATLPWSSITEKPTTIDGYGITDAYTKSAITNLLASKADKAIAISAGAGLTGGGTLAENRTLALATCGSSGTYTKVSTDIYGRVTSGSTPTTLAGYSISNAYTKDETTSLITAKETQIQASLFDLDARLQSLAVVGSLSELALSHLDTETAGIENLAADLIEARAITATEGFTGNLSGNASTASKLQTARTIWGQSFDGGGNVDGCLNITSDSVGSYTQGIRIWQISASNMSSVWFGCSSYNGYNAGMWGLSATNSGNFRIRGGASAASDLVNITQSGNVGIGTTSPACALHVIGDIAASGAITALSAASSSDIRLKKNIAYEAMPLERMASVMPAKFEFLSQPGITRCGAIAQELREILPEAIGADARDFLTVEYGNAALYLVLSLAREVLRLKQFLQSPNNQLTP